MHRGLLRNALLLVAVAVLVLEVGGGGEAAPRVRGTRRTAVRALLKGPMFAFASDRDRYPKGTSTGYTLSKAAPLAMYDPDGPDCSDLWVYDIYVATEHTTGIHVKRLTTHTANDWQPSWSPDGKRLAFCSFRDDPDGDIYTMKSDGTDVQRLTDEVGVDWYPRWSPIGDRILWSRCSGGAGVWVMDVDGGNKQNLTQGQSGSPSFADWSPNGGRIVFESTRDGHRQIFRMKADGSNRTRLTYALAHDRKPAWSPDGNHIAFSRGLPRPNQSPNDEIYVMKPNGTEVTRLTHSSPNEIEPTWSPNSKTILFSTAGGGGKGWDISAINVDGSGLRELTSDDFTTWQPDYLVIP